MWEFNKIVLKNFVSHKYTVYKFHQGKTTLIYGKNLDDTGSESNGSGKSSFLLGLTITLLDIVNRDLSKHDLIRDKQKSCVLKGYLSNKVLNQELIIRREYKRKGKNKIQLIINGKEKVLSGVSEYNKHILELIGISKDDLLNYFLISQDNSHSFITSGDGDKKKIITRFVKAEKIDKSLEKIEEESKELQEKIEKKNSIIERIEIKIETLHEQIKYEEENWNKNSEEERNKISTKIKNINNTLIELNNKQEDTKKAIKQAKEGIEKIVIEDNVELKKEMQEILADMNGKKELLDKNEKKEDEYKRKTRGEVTCPNCSHQWSMSNPKDDIKKIKTLLQNLEKNNNELRIEIEKLDEKYDKQELLYNKSNVKRQTLEGWKERLKGSLNKLEYLKAEYTERKEELGKLEKELKDIKEGSKDIKKIKFLNNKIKSKERFIEKKSNQIDILVKKKEEIDFWKVHLGLNGFKTFLVNKTLSIIEGNINFQLKKFKTDLRIKINGYKQLASGDFREKIDILVSKNESDWKKYGRFSGGQKSRITICSIIALQKMINNTAKGGGLNLLVIDEILDQFLDQPGWNSAINIFRRSNITNLIVSHKYENLYNDNQIMFEYKNEISKIKE